MPLLHRNLQTSAKQKEIEDCLQFGKEILNQACNSDVMELKCVLKERLQDLNGRRQRAQPSIKLLHISYIKNDSLFDAVKRLGTLETLSFDPLRCKAKGEVINKAEVGEWSHFVVTNGIKKPEKEAHVPVDRVTVSIRSLKGQPDIIPEVNAQGNGTYRVSYKPQHEQRGKYRIEVKVNEEEIAGSPFDLSVTPLFAGEIILFILLFC